MNRDLQGDEQGDEPPGRLTAPTREINLRGDEPPGSRTATTGEKDRDLRPGRGDLLDRITEELVH